MTVQQKAQEAYEAWLKWVKREGGAYWRNGNLADEDKDAWLRGYYLGLEHKLSGRHDADVTDQQLWDYGENMEYFRDETTPSEMMGKCHAAGYMAGYQLAKLGGGVWMTKSGLQ